MARVNLQTVKAPRTPTSVFHRTLRVRLAPRFRVALAALLMAAAISAGLAVWAASGTRTSESPAGPFGWLTSSSPPAEWQLVGQPGLGTVPVPPGFRAVRTDAGTVSVALVNSTGSYLGYLNTTPRQGNESLRGWAPFRLSHLLDDDAISARAEASVESIRTEAGLRSCVIDDYVTRVDHHHFHEVACLVASGSSSSVVVAATPSGDPGHVWNELERSVAAYPSA